ncbi:hypothetical protein NQ318_020409, partial [Aromia moschata]
MELEEEIVLEYDIDIIDILDFGFLHLHVRPNYIEDMDDLVFFFRRFRLMKITVMFILGFVEDQLEFDNDLNDSVSPVNQLLTALMFYTSSSHQITVGDFMHTNQSTVSRTVKRVSEAIASLHNLFIKMTSTPGKIIACQTKFYQV